MHLFLKWEGKKHFENNRMESCSGAAPPLRFVTTDDKASALWGLLCKSLFGAVFCMFLGCRSPFVAGHA